jgi:ferredoxin
MKFALLLLGLVAVVYASDKSCTATIAKYPGYAGVQAVTGRVIVTGNNYKDKTKLEYHLAGLEGSANSGLHIHTGITCQDASYVSGHYYAGEADGEDPWTTTVASDSSGVSVGNLEVKDGIDYAGTIGHAVVVHDAAGARIGCGVCVESCTAKIKKYPGYDGSLKAAGTVTVSASVEASYSSTLNVTYDITGATPTTNTSDSKYAGIHVHVGVDCDKDYVDGHYYATAADPWTTSQLTNAAGDASGSFSVVAGLNYQAQIGHTVVVHADDTDSTRIGCGVCVPDGYSDSSSMLPDWAWILVVIGSALLCAGCAFGVACIMFKGVGGGNDGNTQGSHQKHNDPDHV